MSRERDEGSSTITKVKKNNNNGSFLSIFMDADRLDMFLMVLGFIGAMADGFSTPLLTLVMARLMNTVGNASNLTTDEFTHKLYYVTLSTFFSLCMFLSWEINSLYYNTCAYNKMY